MHRHWEKTILPLIKKIKPNHIVEIGSEIGTNTKNILKYCKENNSKLTSIDPNPIFNVEELKENYGEKFNFYKDLSLRALPFLDKFDMILIDGDHNWYTVFNELKTIENIYKKHDYYPIIILHDTGWPYGRRDLYYNPDTIPKEYLLPYDELGMIPNEKGLSKDKGLNNHGLNNALYEGGEKNGVLTAIEDYIGDSSLDLSFYSIPAYHGLGILFLKNDKIQKIVEDTIDYPSIIEDLEKYYLKIITSDMEEKKQELTHKINEQNKLINTISEEKAQLQKQNNEKSKLVDVLSGEKAQLQKQISEQKELIGALSGEKAQLQKQINEKNKTINTLTEEKTNEIKKIGKNHEKNIKSMHEKLEELKTTLGEKENQNKSLNDKVNINKRTIYEKDNQIKFLKEEIKVLNKIIKENDESHKE